DFMVEIARIPPLTPKEFATRFPDYPQPDTELRRGMARVFYSLREIRLCDRERSGASPRTRIHGLFLPATWSIRIYRSACTASSIYGQELDPLNNGHKIALVVGHEVGHVIDALAGDLQSNGTCKCEYREDRATIYGSYVGQCIARLMRELLRGGE